MSVITSTWVERDGLLRSPLLERYHVVAGFTTRAQGSMAGSVFPLDDQERNRQRLARALGFDAIARVRQVHGNTVVRLVRSQAIPDGTELVLRPTVGVGPDVRDAERSVLSPGHFSGRLSPGARQHPGA